LILATTIPLPVLGQAAEEGGGGGATTAIGWTLFAIIIIGFAIGVVLNARRGRQEVGAEIELAANRRPYLSDEELETKKLDRTLGFGLVLLAILGVSLPLYWLGEPGRQEGAVEDFQDQFIGRGEDLYENGAQCVNCHGPNGVGGSAQTALLNDRGEFVSMITWQAPALNNVLYRYSREEVFEILQYGRPFSPMAAWGSEGGGPLTDQQIYNIVDYLESIQLPANEVRDEVAKELEETCRPDDGGRCTLPSARFATLGEAMFNMGLYTGFSGGSYSCGRCHTPGWSWGDPGESGSGAYGPNLTGGRTLQQFPAFMSQYDFIAKGAEKGKRYGTQGQAGDGGMPGFGINPNATVEGSKMSPDQVMYTDEQIRAVVEYERGM
jgi:mono/diheme cytochrome c family protein